MYKHINLEANETRIKYINYMLQKQRLKIIRINSSYLLPNIEWNISVFYHVPNLAPHCEYKKNNPVTEQYRPKDRNIKDGEEGHDERNAKSFGEWVPETMIERKYYLKCKEIIAWKIHQEKSASTSKYSLPGNACLQFIKKPWHFSVQTTKNYYSIRGGMHTLAQRKGNKSTKSFFYLIRFSSKLEALVVKHTRPRASSIHW